MPSAVVNLDLLSVGISIAAIGIIGFSVVFSNSKSITNKTFLLFSLVTVFWGIVNFLSYHSPSAGISLFFLRLVIASAVWHAFSFFQLGYVFPNEKVSFPIWYERILVPLVVLSSIINLTSLSFSGVKSFASGQSAVVNQGPGMLLFAALIVFLIFGGFFNLVKSIRKASGIEKIRSSFVFIGSLLTFALLFIFNFLLPAAFNFVAFIPLGAVAFFPLITFTSYAIFEYRLFNVKIIATEFLVFALAITMLFQVLTVQGWQAISFRVGIFAFVLIFGIPLIQSVLNEVRQREELERLTEQLKKVNVKLEELNRFKTELLSLVSHQIKSPLAAVKGFVSLIIDGTYGAIGEKVKETLGKVKDATDELINLVNTLLNLRKVEEGKMDYSFEKVNVADLAEKVVGELKLLADNKKLNLSFVSDKPEIFVNADSQKLAQAIQNMVDNAIKYTPSGFVKVEVKESEGDAVISVSDSGLGISAELLPHVFEEFTRDERVRKEIRGTGLGLYIAKAIVQAHGGEIKAESAGEGKGSRFYVRLKKYAP